MTRRRALLKLIRAPETGCAALRGELARKQLNGACASLVGGAEVALGSRRGGAPPGWGRGGEKQPWGGRWLRVGLELGELQGGF